MSTPAENLKVNKTFVAWMDEHANFRDICEVGKGRHTSTFYGAWTWLSTQGPAVEKLFFWAQCYKNLHIFYVNILFALKKEP